MPFRKIHLKSLSILAGADSIGGLLQGGEPGREPGDEPDDDPRVAIVARARVETKLHAGNIRVDVNEVNIPVTVADPLGKPVPGLPSAAFHIYENGVEQTVARLSQEDSPSSRDLSSLPCMLVLASNSNPMESRMFPVGNINQLPQAMSKVSAALREQYNLVYSPRNSARDGKYRSVQFKPTHPPGFSPLHASYYTPYTP